MAIQLIRMGEKILKFRMFNELERKKYLNLPFEQLEC